jgi:K+-transporting ATPase KdpF subunit
MPTLQAPGHHEGVRNGHHVSAGHTNFLRFERGAGPWLRTAEEARMSWIYVLSGLVTLAIFVYLLVALFFPEKF